MIYNIEKLFLIFIIYSFLGWIVEIINEIVTTKNFVNRGFLIGPYCPIYGVGGLLIYLLLNRFSNNILLLFICSIIICSLIEYITSYIMEKLFDARWWDYTNRKYNINGRICLETMIPFGLLGVAMIYFINPIILKIVSKANPIIINYICIILFSIFVIDIVISTIILKNIKNDIEKVDKDNTEEITKKIKQVLSKNILTRRLFKAFPNVKYIKNVIKKNINKVKESGKKVKNLKKTKMQ